jgi:signal transduction histidine kinase
MKRPWQVWLAFTLCATVTFAAMGWLTWHAVQADIQSNKSRVLADLEQRISLVLWRMDTRLAPLIAEEVARPPSFYQSAPEIPTNAEAQQQAPPQPSASIEPAPFVHLNFSNRLNGQWESPQIPYAPANQSAQSHNPIQQNKSQSLLNQLAADVNVEELLAQLPNQPLPNVLLQTEPSSSEPFYAANQMALSKTVPAPSTKSSTSSQPDGNQLQQRAQRFLDVTQNEYRKQRATLPNSNPSTNIDQAIQLSESISRPVWSGDKLLLARRVVQDGQTVVQGSWLDWPALRRELLTEAADVLPNASLTPVRDTTQGSPTRMLAGLPVELHTGEKIILASVSPSMRWALSAGWVAISLAVFAVGGLLWGVIALSERRAAFVSSVTHELRTPLTTFRMYSEMLARDMVPDSSKRKQYLETLHREAERLTHLVENVLAYARLERGRKPRQHDHVAVGQLLSRLQPRLTDRANQSDMQLQVSIAPEVANLQLTTDVSAVEQILFNLVDNASKYAANAEDRNIHCSATATNTSIQFTIRDHGSGFANSLRPQPFSKTAEEAAVSAPGVGLGLALCRRLAKQLGGKLEIDSTPDGTTATLNLPIL